jgi:hypothetical protein
MLIMQNLDEILLHKYCEKRVFIVTYFLTYNKSRKKKKKNTREYTWRKLEKLLKLVVKDQNDKWKSRRIRMYKIGKISDPILIDKRPIRWKYFYLG